VLRLQLLQLYQVNSFRLKAFQIISSGIFSLECEFFSSKLLNPLIFTVHSNNEKRTPREIYKKREMERKKRWKDKNVMERKKKGRYGNCNEIPSQFIPSLSLLHLSHFFFHLFPLGMKTLPSITICVSVCVCVYVCVCEYVCVCLSVCGPSILTGTRKMKKIDRKRCSES
jgi:hypothetical protein